MEVKTVRKGGVKGLPRLVSFSGGQPPETGKKDPQRPASPRSGRFRGPGESKPPAGFAAFDRSKAEKILFLVEKPIINPKGKMVWKP